MDNFSYEKERALNRTDHSQKGRVDEHIIPLLDAINTHPDYYTTSSCAGRILLIASPENPKKHQHHWLIVEHNTANTHQFSQALHSAKDPQVFLAMQAAIVHVACRTIHDAQRLLDTIRWKRSGIIRIEPYALVQLIASEHLHIPLRIRGETIITNTQLAQMLAHANELLARTHTRIVEAEERIGSFLGAS